MTEQYTPRTDAVRAELAAAVTHDTVFRTDFDTLVSLTGARIVRTSA